MKYNSANWEAVRNMSGLRWLLRRANQIWRTEGLITLFRRGFQLVVRRFFLYEAYYLYEHTTDNIRYSSEADFLPRIRDFTFNVVSTNQEADKLEEEGLEFRSQAINAREKLAKGGIAFCVFVGPQLAHIGWVATTEGARTAADTLPYRVDFPGGQACTGGTETTPQHREKGLMAYGYFKRLQYLQEKGVRTSRNAVDTSNIASQKVHAKFNPKIYARV